MGQLKSARLQTLKKLAAWSERDASRALNEVQARLQMEQAQLEGLKLYYQDYLVTIDQQKALTSQELISYRQFCIQLAQTIKQGEQRIIVISDELDAKKNHWLLRRNKRRALEDLIENCVRAENQLIEQKLQREIEDLWQSWH